MNSGSGNGLSRYWAWSSAARGERRMVHDIGLEAGTTSDCGRHQSVVQGPSFSGFRTAQMCLIRLSTTSKAYTVTMTPFCRATSPG
jgi:hypothetical protein